MGSLHADEKTKNWLNINFLRVGQNSEGANSKGCATLLKIVPEYKKIYEVFFKIIGVGAKERRVIKIQFLKRV